MQIENKTNRILVIEGLALLPGDNEVEKLTDLQKKGIGEFKDTIVIGKKLTQKEPQE